jgi:hypothetical protein
MLALCYGRNIDEGQGFLSKLQGLDLIRGQNQARIGLWRAGLREVNERRTNVLRSGCGR